jgi:heterodisulfide reductase subunit B
VEYAWFLGCTVPARAQNYEMSARKVAEKLGLAITDVENFACCGFPIKPIHREGAMVMAARNLALAEVNGVSLCTLCAACTGIITEVNALMREDSDFAADINRQLSVIGLKYNGTVDVKHFVRLLYEDVGLDGIKKHIVNDLDGFPVAVHDGCHYLKPSEIYGGFDSPERPATLDALVELTGARSVPYFERKRCCGGSLLGVEEPTALTVAGRKLAEVRDSEAEALIIVCPFCSVMYDANQKKIETLLQEELQVPVMYYPQLLGLALGIPDKELGFRMNRLVPPSLLERAAS